MLISQKRSVIMSGRRAKGNPIAPRIARQYFLRQTIDGQVAPEKIQKKCKNAGGQ
jgi:hypothetical protein